MNDILKCVIDILDIKSSIKFMLLCKKFKNIFNNTTSLEEKYKNNYMEIINTCLTILNNNDEDKHVKYWKINNETYDELNFIIFPYNNGIKLCGLLKIETEVETNRNSYFNYTTHIMINEIKYNKKNINLLTNQSMQKYLQGIILLLKNKSVNNDVYFNRSIYEKNIYEDIKFLENYIDADLVLIFIYNIIVKKDNEEYLCFYKPYFYKIMRCVMPGNNYTNLFESAIISLVNKPDPTVYIE